MESRKWWILICFAVSCTSAFELRPWTYKCDNLKRCVKDKLSDDSSHIPDGLSLAKCKLTCDPHAVLWPRPRHVKIGGEAQTFSLDHVEFVNKDSIKSTESARLIQRNIDEQVELARQKRIVDGKDKPAGYSLHIDVDVRYDPEGDKKLLFSRKVNETYTLKVTADDEEKVITANIHGPCYFGVRLALETLFQLVEYDDIARRYIIVKEVDITDYPEFAHRGITLDTNRNFIRPEVIKRILDGMGHSKLNTFHWHISDTHSYPIEHIAEPINQMANYGAYDSDSVYTQDIIRDIVEHAHYRGIQVIPEFDQPAHVGNGWQFPGAEDYTVCLNAEPWYDYCVEPPCGQLNPTQPKIYDVLEKIYVEFYDMFKFETFHLGADEVNLRCWNSSKIITDYMEANNMPRTEESFVELWSDFMTKSVERLRRAVPDDSTSKLDLVVWTSELTSKKYIDRLNPKDYIIQIWSNGTDIDDSQIKALIDKGYRVIFSNYDALYLDCGYGAWVGEGNNWCSPYKGWQKIYENDPYELLKSRKIDLTASVKKQVLGGEAAMWTEQVDSEAVEGKIFPRAAALAERLWTSPEEGWYEAEQRMLEHRRRLVHRGINADALQPEWCRQNSGQCYVGANNPHTQDNNEE